jgi:hypothetical protein
MGRVPLIHCINRRLYRIAFSFAENETFLMAETDWDALFLEYYGKYCEAKEQKAGFKDLVVRRLLQKEASGTY